MAKVYQLKGMRKFFVAAVLCLGLALSMTLAVGVVSPSRADALTCHSSATSSTLKTMCYGGIQRAWAVCKSYTTNRETTAYGAWVGKMVWSYARCPSGYGVLYGGYERG